ncbi:hypothetical protein M6B38_147340 [Iris pallida]|uniref:Uncharacterized protein n=1 Tax=Iris pallida TaxID=29817 RepID=A0AAX6FAC1_IRIPA|nr:hypothetical protein M6B38_147340 [Iris pallida]
MMEKPQVASVGCVAVARPMTCTKSNRFGRKRRHTYLRGGARSELVF